jgi:site-specific DNA-methyltransferase (adenine-specific)
MSNATTYSEGNWGMNAIETGIIQGDCVEEMAKMEAGSVDLAFADPPFNIGYQYDVYEDEKGYEEYLDWTAKWVHQVDRLLKPNGTFWLAIGDAFASDLDVLCRRQFGFTRRSWVVWHYTFGVNSVKKFTPSHTHLFHYVKDPKQFTFNAAPVKVPSARQLVYGDKRAKAGGRLPDDVWVLRPQTEPSAFDPESDTWFVPRVCGTYKERVGWHPCQMPLAVMDRIIKVSSNPGDLVLDPFAGSGTTLAAARSLGRETIGIELSENYVEGILTRLADVPSF